MIVHTVEVRPKTPPATEAEPGTRADADADATAAEMRHNKSNSTDGAGETGFYIHFDFTQIGLWWERIRSAK